MLCSNILSSASQLKTQHTCIRTQRSFFSCKRFTSEPFWEKLQEFLSMWIAVQFALLPNLCVVWNTVHMPYRDVIILISASLHHGPDWRAGNVPNAVPHPTSFQPGTKRQCRDHVPSQCYLTSPLQVACSHHSLCSAWSPARQIDADSWRQSCPW